MSAGFVRVATDSTGKKLQTFENVLGADDVHAEAVVLVDGSGVVVSSWPVTGTFWQATQPVSAAALPLPTLAATSTKQSDGSHKTQIVDGSGNVAGVNGNSIYVSISSSSITQPISGTVAVAGGGNTSIAKLEDDPSANGHMGAAMMAVQKATPGNTAGLDGDYEFLQMSAGKLWVDGSAVTQPVSIAATVTTKESRSGTAATSQVADTAVTTTLLASNANRLGATIQNDSSAVLYVKLGTTASATDYTVRLVQYSYFELPFGYTGRIDGIWATDPNDGAARITELT